MASGPMRCCPARSNFGWRLGRHAPTQNPADLRDGAHRSIPFGRLGKPEEIADAAVWLVSARAGWVTGAALGVDGGAGQGYPLTCPPSSETNAGVRVACACACTSPPACPASGRQRAGRGFFLPKFRPAGLALTKALSEALREGWRWRLLRAASRGPASERSITSASSSPSDAPVRAAAAANFSAMVRGIWK